MKQFLITALLLLVLVDVTSSTYSRWFRSRISRNLLKICNKQSILDKLCPVEDACANIDCSCNGACNDGVCTCEPGFTGDNCEVEDICTIPNFCQNGATCMNNQCQCRENFIGEMCEICTNFVREDRNLIVTGQFQISVPEFDDIVSCAGRCASFEDCTASIVRNGDCVFFREPVLDVLDLPANTDPEECALICLNTEGCASAFTLSTTCTLFSEEDVEFETNPFGGASINVLIRQCDV